jgi:hypothetical protein
VEDVVADLQVSLFLGQGTHLPLSQLFVAYCCPPSPENFSWLIEVASLSGHTSLPGACSAEQCLTDMALSKVTLLTIKGHALAWKRSGLTGQLTVQNPTTSSCIRPKQDFIFIFFSFAILLYSFD